MAFWLKSSYVIWRYLSKSTIICLNPLATLKFSYAKIIWPCLNFFLTEWQTVLDFYNFFKSHHKSNLLRHESISKLLLWFTLRNCLGGELFSFPWEAFFSSPSFRWKSAWAVNKIGLCWGRKVLNKFQTAWIFNMSTCSNSNPSLALATGILGFIMNMWTCWRSKIFETY